jgi:hypothetical protein
MSALTGRESEKFVLRLPDGMRDRIRLAAEASSRSMNAEIIATLEDKYPAPAGDTNVRGLAEMLADALRSDVFKQGGADVAFDIPIDELREVLERALGPGSPRGGPRKAVRGD